MSTIAQSIREAAITGGLGTAPHYFYSNLPIVERGIVITFLEPNEYMNAEDLAVHIPTFFLLVAEALSQDLPREELLTAADFLCGKLWGLSQREGDRIAAVLRKLAKEAS